MAASASLEIAMRFLSLVAQPGDVFELRGLARVNGQQHTTSGYFDDPAELARAAAERSGKDDGVYVTLNPVKPELLFRAPKNRVRRAGSGDTTSDRDVVRRRLLLVDVDPVRPAGISSSDDEHAAAIALARTIRDDLAALGWPAPIVADSGNGAHLLFGIDLPADDGGLVARVLSALSKKYTTAALKIDEKVFNAARISKIYGTLTRKGVDAPERPHRLARLLDVPDTLAAVDRALLDRFAPEKLIDAVKREANAYSVEARTFDLAAWIAERLPDARERNWNEGRRWILPVCPFNDQHDRGEAAIVQLHSGAVSAKCQHESCVWGWKDLRAKLEPNYAERRDRFENGNGNGNGSGNGNGTHRKLTDRTPPPEVVYEDASAAAELEAFAARDRDPPAAAAEIVVEKARAWRRAPEIVGEIWARKDDPWVSLCVGGDPLTIGDELARVRAGGIAVVMGGSGSGKSSLVANFLIHHALHTGPAIAVSIELPADEFGGRVAGIRRGIAWEETLRGGMPYDELAAALDLPRLYVLERENATLENLIACARQAALDFPGQPILVAIDYAQLLESTAREERLRVADSFKRIDRASRSERFATIAVSQMSRVGAREARSGDRLGSETSDLGAETAAIERFATVTLTIGKMSDPREDRTQLVELSIGKSRMGAGGDTVRAMTYAGFSGKWRVDGEAKTASKVREERDVEKLKREKTTLENQIVGAVTSARQPLSRNEISEVVIGKRELKLAALKELLLRGVLVEVARRAPKSRSWLIWTPDRASDAGVQLVREIPTLGID